VTDRYRLSVVIPSFERCGSVRRALEALGRQTVPPEQYEVIVSVDGSDDGTREMVERFPASYALRALWQPNRGRAAACNAGIRAAEGEVVVLLDDDMEAAPGFLAGHDEAHPPGSRRAVVGAAPVALDPSAPPLAGYMGRAFAQRLGHLASTGRVRCTEAYTGNFSAPRALLLEVGGFDEGFRLYGHEDYELTLRLLRAGVTLGFSSDALAYQYYEKDFASAARDGMARGRTAVLFARKHPEVGDQLRLGAYHRETWKWRLLRGVLLRFSAASARVPDLVIALVKRLERRRPARLDRYYTMALDYFYWLGVRAALRQRDPCAPSA
jgi:GT2 family glycosyltransferase